MSYLLLYCMGCWKRERERDAARPTCNQLMGHERPCAAQLLFVSPPDKRRAQICNFMLSSLCGRPAALIIMTLGLMIGDNHFHRKTNFEFMSKAVRRCFLVLFFTATKKLFVIDKGELCFNLPKKSIACTGPDARSNSVAWAGIILANLC